MKKVTTVLEQFTQERNWNNLEPADLAKSIIIEAAELLELFQWSNLSTQEIQADKQTAQKINHELADIMIYCLEMALTLGIDPETIILDKIKYNSEKYPADTVRDNHEAHINIKQAYRDERSKNE